MPCDNKPVDRNSAQPNTSHEPATLWEHFVLHKAAEKKVMLFDLDIGDQQFRANRSQKKRRKMSDLDTATTIMMRERQRSNSAPVPISNPTSPATTNNETNGNPPKAFLATLEPVQSFSTSYTSHSTSVTASFDSVTLDSSHRVIFGAYQLLALPPETLHDEAERQAALVRGRQTEGLTMKHRFFVDEGLSVRDEELIMSGALDDADLRCEICAARERAMGGLEEAGIVAL